MGRVRRALERRAAVGEVRGGCAERERRAAALGAGCWLFEGQRLAKESDVRVSTAFKRLLRLPGASVVDVGFGAGGGDRDRATAAPATRVFAVRPDRPPARDPRPPRQ